jgi:hypothetical protein
MPPTRTGNELAVQEFRRRTRAFRDNHRTR